MAIINKTGITDGGTIQAEHVTRAIDALSGGSTDTVVATGSFSGSFKGDGSQLSGVAAGFPYTGSAQITGSLVVKESEIIEIINSETRTLARSGGDITVDWDNLQLYSNGISIDWQNRILYDPDESESVNWSSRELYNSLGQSVVNWDTALFSGSITFATSASRAVTASFALNAEGAGFPFTGSARITGSLAVTGSFVQRSSSGQLLISSDTNSTMSIDHDVVNLSSEEINVDSNMYFGDRSGLDLSGMKAQMGLRIPLNAPSPGLTTTGSMYFDALNQILYIHDGIQWTFVQLTT